MNVTFDWGGSDPASQTMQGGPDQGSVGFVYSSGPHNAAVAVNDDSVGTENWTDPNAARKLDTDAGYSSGYAYVYFGVPLVSHYLKLTDFGFEIPDDATILGIVAKVHRWSSGAQDNAVRIVKSTGAIGTTDKKKIEPWAWPDEGYMSYGSPSDTWGEAWTPADINDPNFGIAISAAGDHSSADIDHVALTVYYTMP